MMLSIGLCALIVGTFTFTGVFLASVSFWWALAGFSAGACLTVLLLVLLQSAIDIVITAERSR